MSGGGCKKHTLGQGGLCWLLERDCRALGSVDTTHAQVGLKAAVVPGYRACMIASGAVEGKGVTEQSNAAGWHLRAKQGARQLHEGSCWAVRWPGSCSVRLPGLDSSCRTLDAVPVTETQL